ncbi:hypothetical protein HRI_004374500 [Hibiscus trionum]|uniref:Reverse transcriptase domain-containing protein n=1 Tax=Hibiscus trionum TaxID=183268 RepID=A0A9W7J2Q6_HIBTR|nr:hypothetical protein HRI_004374500 [Hibiscus trionum]
MNLLCWNVRGLGKPRAVNRLKNKLRGVHPHILFLIETKLDKRRMEKVRRHCGFMFGIDVPALGTRGGLSIGWKNECDVSLRSYSQWHIDIEIKEESGIVWRFTGFYGRPEERNRAESWNLLKQLGRDQSLPWVVAGDFNEIAYSFEKMGGCVRSERQMFDFRDALQKCDLADLGFTGLWYTWEKGRLPSTNIRERLDRAVANTAWWELFPGYSITHLTHSISDHCPVLINTKGSSVSNCSIQKKPFRFESSWVLEDDLVERIKNHWETSDSQFPIRMTELGGILENWSLNKKKDRGERKKTLQRRLSDLMSADPDEESLAELLEVKLGLNMEADKEELYWEQRARVNWLKYGDKNTLFFYNFATMRKKQNSIRGIKNEAGDWVTRDGDMLRVATDYFQNLFNSATVANSPSIVDSIQPKITTEMNESLLRPFTLDEIKEAVDGMAPLKASGLDGYPAMFYQKFWNIVGSDLSIYCMSVLNGSSEVQPINNTLIVLIPKVNTPENMTEFRPISLCNVLYKIVAKVLANRLKITLEGCIDKAQGAFIPGRHISDNVLISYEILHSLQQKRSGKKGTFALKADMSKAYDRVEWDFLERVILKLGYAEQWVQMIMRCVSTVSYAVGLNGNIGRNFIPSRGLRQGDPLSPYLFLLCAEGLSYLINSANANGELEGASIGRSHFEVSHLLFADDSIIFSEASMSRARNLQSILTAYENESGQKVNYNKSLIFFSKNVEECTRRQIGDFLGVRISTNPEKYLGLPTMVGRRKREAFAYFLDRFNKKTDNWGIRFLSIGGREVLISAVLQAIPVYAMQCFLLPSTLCKKLEQLMANFWWRNSANKKGIHWCSWKKLANPKLKGGMGFKDLTQFNIALLTKQAWRLLAHPQCLLAQVLKARYYPNTNFLEAGLGSYPSYTWRSVWSCRALLEKGLCWRIGSGSSVNIWNDPWLPGPENNYIQAQQINIQYTKVADLINQQNATWKFEILERLFDDQQVKRISSIPLSADHRQDELIWKFDGTGEYNVKSGYRVLQQEDTSLTTGQNAQTHSNLSHCYAKIWDASLPTKIRIHGWKVLNNYLPTFSNLLHRRLNTVNICKLCGEYGENVEHIFRDCLFTKNLFQVLGETLPENVSSFDWESWFCSLISSLNITKVNTVLVIYWAIWFHRNKIIHEGTLPSIPTVQGFVSSFFIEARESTAHQQQVIAQRTVRWQPPTEGVAKFNFDASFNRLEGSSVSGVVGRNTDGKIMAACSIKHPSVADPFAAEAHACLVTIRFLKDLGFRRATVEGDSRTVIRKLNQTTHDRSLIGPIIHDIKEESKGFDFIEFRFTHQEANGAAHLMARLGRNLDSPSYWIEEAPAAVMDLVESEEHQLRSIS